MCVLKQQPVNKLIIKNDYESKNIPTQHLLTIYSIIVYEYSIHNNHKKYTTSRAEKNRVFYMY